MTTTKGGLRGGRKIPSDIYDRVLGHALDMVNAVMKDDFARRAASYRRLKSYWKAQEAKGRFHPFLPETVADFATWRGVRLRLYRYALRMAQRMGERQDTILVSVAEIHAERGNTAAAKRCLRAAHVSALRCGDRNAAREVAELLKGAPRSLLLADGAERHG